MASPGRLAAPSGSRWPLRILRGVARLLTAAGLALDAYVHAHLAGQYDAVTESISQGTLFRLEAALASLAALLILVWHSRVSSAYAWLVAAGGLALLLIYYWVDVGTLGPFPNMYEPVWTNYKTLSVVGQAVTVVAAMFLLVTRRYVRPRRRRARGRRRMFGRREDRLA